MTGTAVPGMLIPKTLSEFPAATSVDPTDIFFISQSGASKKATAAQIVSGGGSVLSVALAMPAIFSVAGSPGTGDVSFIVTLATEVANSVWAGPTTGGDAAPTFRALVAADIPSLDAAKITSGVFPLDRGGTDAATAQGARLSILPSVTGNAGKALRVNAGETDFDYVTLTTGTVTSVGLSGTANEITVSGASPITSSGSWTLSLPSALTFTGKTITGGGFTGGTWNNGIIGGSTPAAGTFTTLTATGQTSLGGVAGAEALRAVVVASAVNWLEARGSTTGNAVELRTNGANTDVAIVYQTRGAGAHNFYTNTASPVRQVQITHTASATRYITLTGSNGGNPTISTSAGSLAITPPIVGDSRITAWNTLATPAGGTAGRGIEMGSAAIGIYFGSGVPTLSATQGSLYMRSNGTGSSDTTYVNTDGSTTWTALATGAGVSLAQVQAAAVSF